MTTDTLRAARQATLRGVLVASDVAARHPGPLGQMALQAARDAHDQAHRDYMLALDRERFA